MNTLWKAAPQQSTGRNAMGKLWEWWRVHGGELSKEHYASLGTVLNALTSTPSGKQCRGIATDEVNDFQEKHDLDNWLLDNSRVDGNGEREYNNSDATLDELVEITRAALQSTPSEEQGDAVAVCKLLLDTWKHAGPDGSGQFEKFDVVIRKAEQVVG